ncbi:MAG: hypothetical protein ACRELX_17860, partial [Longimicrobiales bacterium]
ADGDAYTGQIVIRTPGGDVVATLAAPESPSGFSSHARLETPLPPGRYLWTAQTRDTHGVSSEWTDQMAFEVRGRQSQ